MIVVLFVAVIALSPLKGQSQEGMEAVMRLLDSEVEDMDGDEVERLSALLKRPVCLNHASHAELLASGLFSRYQVASLMDYRERSGEVMSFMELASVDGFSDDFVMRIRPFISLEKRFSESRDRLDNEILVRSAVKRNGDIMKYSYDSRYKMAVGDMLAASIGLSRSSDASLWYPDNLTGYVEYKMTKTPARLILGDFNARFGQGLAMWNGMNLSSLYSPSSFMRRPSGLTASGSVTGKYAFSGLASEFSLGNFIVSAMFAVPGIKQAGKRPDKVSLMPAANLTYQFRAGQCGLTHFAEFSGFGTALYIPSMKTAADVSVCHKGMDLFAELAYEWVCHEFLSRGGVVFPLGDVVDAAAMLRMSRDEYALALSAGVLTGRWMNIKGEDVSRRRLDGTVSADVVFYPEPKSDTQDHSLQLKLHTQWHYVVFESFRLSFRLTERIRSWGQGFRTDVRSDLHWNSERFSASARLNLLRCRGTSFLAYAEGGCKFGRFALYLRQGVFIVDNWDDRIYVYERDAPGTFNVPAYYGRGVWTSLMTSWKFSRHGRLYCRAGAVSYPLMKEKKPGRAELRLQSVIDF